MGRESGDLGKRPKISSDRVTPRDFYATISSLGRGCEISSGNFYGTMVRDGIQLTIDHDTTAWAFKMAD